MPTSRRSNSRSLESLVSSLRVPEDPLVSHRAGTLVLPENIICFHHEKASNLNQPRDGRALHHRLVLMFALHTAVTVCVDDRALRLKAGEGLLVLPFQFHHYTEPAREDIQWLFVTFEVNDPSLLEPLRYRPFELTEEIRDLVAGLVEIYQKPAHNDVLRLQLGLLLAHLRRLDPSRSPVAAPPKSPGIVTQVNLLAQRSGEPQRVRELADELGISVSHLRARFRATCGVSLGRHLNRLRLEKACEQLRLTRDRVSSIAEQCGFSSVHSFSRAFRTAYGMSPMDYRRQREPVQ